MVRHSYLENQERRAEMSKKIEEIDAEKFAILLSKTRSDIQRQLEQTRESLCEQVREPRPLKSHEADRDENFPRLSVVTRRYSTLEELLRRCDSADRRLKEGTYGICEMCEENIPFRRLEAMPFTNLCKPCKERTE